MSFRLGVDTGGTFTDIGLFYEETEEVMVVKVPSTPNNPSLAVIDGIKTVMEQQDITARDITFFIHGTTVATNALLELKGAKSALITTEGFRDVLAIGRQTRPSLYDFNAHRPKAIIPRQFRYEVPERILFTGDVERPLNENKVYEIVRQIKKQEIESVAVCLLHSYANSSHEKRIKEILRMEYPEVFITLSSEVLPEFREYERSSTVSINAYVMPKVNRYVADLVVRLKEMGVKSKLYIMQSNGGVITAETAKEASARTVLSGPAGGALAGTFICKQTGRDNIITVDMGGTSLDICLIDQREPRFTTESQIGGYPIKLPMIDIHTIGAGGGSIAWIDRGNALKVGPESAGAVPGPVSYGKGGDEPTVTDANVVLGRINPKHILGGKFDIDLAGARKVIEEKIAKPLGLSIEDAASGIVRVVNANMVRGIRVVSVEKGYDPREFGLVAFGGAGPVHAVEMAQELGMSEVIVPINPGITSALGMLVADVRHDFVQTYVKNIDQIKSDELAGLYREMEKQGAEQLEEEGFKGSEMVFLRTADIRYHGQAYELSVNLPGGELREKDIQMAIEAFHQEHYKAYGYKREKDVVELVNVRLVALGKLPKMDVSKGTLKDMGLPEPLEYRNVFFNNGAIETPIFDRDKLFSGNTITGPAVVEQLDSTTVIFPGQTSVVDEFGNIIIRLEDKQ